MEMQKRNITIRIIAAAAYILMVIINILANLLPINGVTTGSASDSYSNLFAPAGYTFSIWGLIYTLLFAYTLYQIGFFQKDDSVKREVLLNRVGILFSISSLANIIWIFSWHYDVIPLSMVMMLVILVCLMAISQTIRKENLTAKESFFITLPFGVYYGWITVATVANATVLLVSLKWDGFGISVSVWTALILIVAMLIGNLAIIKNKDIPYGLVLIWAYFGILVKHISAEGYSGQYPLVILIITLCILLFAFAIVYLIFSKRFFKNR